MPTFALVMSRRLLHIIQWTVALCAYAYLIYRLATYDDYASLSTTLRSMSTRQWLALALCVALMPVNMLLEAWRWRTLIPMSWREAQRQIYYSRLAALVTPWHLGEYPARAILMDQSPITNPLPHVLSMGAVASATLTAAIILLGTLGLCFSPNVLTWLGNSYLYALTAIVLLLCICMALAPKWLRRWADINATLITRSLLQSIVRVLCWCLQLALVLYALGVFDSSALDIQSQITNYKLQITNLPLYYLLVTVSPNVPLAEVGVRGAWAMFLFGSVDAALAGVLLWMINSLLPCLAWPFISRSSSPK